MLENVLCIMYKNPTESLKNKQNDPCGIYKSGDSYKNYYLNETENYIILLLAAESWHFICNNHKKS